MTCKFPEVTHIETDITCPYCGKRISDSCEMLDEDGDSDKFDCDCGKTFMAEKSVTVDYRSSKDCELNNEAHEYEVCKHNPAWKVCKKCGMNQTID